MLLLLIGAVIAPFQELVWRQTVLEQRGVIDSLSDTVVLWLLMLGVGIGWGFASLIIVLPVSLIAALFLGGIPPGLVYLVSGSGIGAAIAGIPLALLALIVVGSVADGLYLVYQSTVWTLGYLEIEGIEDRESEKEDVSSPDNQPLSPDPLPET